jgi:hypothetical protein
VEDGFCAVQEENGTLNTKLNKRLCAADGIQQFFEGDSDSRRGVITLVADEMKFSQSR